MYWAVLQLTTVNNDTHILNKQHNNDDDGDDVYEQWIQIWVTTSQQTWIGKSRRKRHFHDVKKDTIDKMTMLVELFNHGDDETIATTTGTISSTSWCPEGKWIRVCGGRVMTKGVVEMLMIPENLHNRNIEEVSI